MIPAATIAGSDGDESEFNPFLADEETQRARLAQQPRLVGGVQEKTDKKSGRLYRYPVHAGKVPEDWWTDIETLNHSDRERTGWPIAFIGDEPAIEYALDVTLEIRDMPRQVKGAPDRIFVLPNKELVIVDIKSGSTTPKTVLQQGEYATLLEQAGHRRPKFGTFVKVGIQPKTGGGKHLPLAPLKKYDAAYFEHLFTAYRTQLETGTFLPNVSDLCDRCGVRSACYAAGGSQSAQYDPLDPNYQGEQ